MSKPLRIDFVSDISCTWCAIALPTLERAVENVVIDAAADFNFQPFELNPQMPQGGQNLIEHMEQKYGLGIGQVHQHFDMTRRRGEEVGFVFDLDDDSRIYNTFDAHRLLHWAKLQGRQRELKHELFDSHFTDRQAPDDRDVLIRLAESAGLDPAEARTVLGSDAYSSEVRDAEREWLNRGVQGVPAVIFNGRVAVSGAQSQDVFENAIRSALADAPVDGAPTI
ncbi:MULTISPECIES: DsbA family oxidoreductase [unclassified Luteimonas]